MQTQDAPVTTSYLTRRVRQMVGAGRSQAARPLLAALRRREADSPELHELEARVLFLEGRTAEALAELGVAVDAAPEDARLRVGRAELLLNEGRLPEAAAEAAEAVVLDRRRSDAKALLGTALGGLGLHADAIACLRDAVQGEPANPAFRRALAELLERSGAPDEAASVLADAIGRAPAVVALRIAAIMLEMRRRDFAMAARLAKAARTAGVADACVFGLLGHALSSDGHPEEAREAYAEALKLAPEDVYVRHLVAACGILPQGDRAPPGYLEAVFDGYAERFEAHLLSLGYRIPGLIRRRLLELPVSGVGPVLDLGCGTGLMSLVAADLKIGPWTGVDISGAMLAQAAGKGLYERLVKADIGEALAELAGDWAVVLAADLFCYFGALDTVFRQVRAVLRDGACFVFSVEELPADADADWRLGRQGRFAHRADYVARVAAQSGFVVHALDHDVLRWEADGPVQGRIGVFGPA